MAKGKTKVKLKGGCYNGEVLEKFDTRFLQKYLNISTGHWYREKGETVEIVKNKKLDSKWLCYETHIYKKGVKDNKGFFEYEFERSKIVDRCSSKTKKGTRCMKSCYQDLSVCEIHNKKSL